MATGDPMRTCRPEPSWGWGVSTIIKNHKQCPVFCILTERLATWLLPQVVFQTRCGATSSHFPSKPRCTMSTRGRGWVRLQATLMTQEPGCPSIYSYAISAYEPIWLQAPPDPCEALPPTESLRTELKHTTMGP
jgi:hypothetical protein